MWISRAALGFAVVASHPRQTLDGLVAGLGLAILSRAIGVNAVFPNPPDFGVISAGFLEDYYAYADSLFACYRGLTPFTPLEPASFGFALYTSDEYLSTIGSGLDEEQA